MTSYRRHVILALLLCGWATSAQAVLFTYSGTNNASGHLLAASADFTFSGSSLTIVLTNTSTQTYATTNLQSNDVLTALFWDVANNPTNLSYTSASTGTGSSLVQTSLSGNITDLRSNDNIGGVQGGWQFKSSTTPLAGVTQKYGVGTAGLGIFVGSNIQSSQSWGSNVDLGVVNGAYQAGQIQPGQLASTPLIRNSIKFVFNTLPANFTIADISNVRFQYGTALADSNGGVLVIPTPEPGTFCAAALGVIGAAIHLRRRALTARTPS